MGKKGGWLSSLKKTFTRSFKEKKIQKNVEEHHSVPDPPIIELAGGSDDSRQFPPLEEVKPIMVVDDPPLNRYPLAVASGGTASISGDAMSSLHLGKSREESAVVMIQTNFRGYLARRTKWALRGLVRLKTVIEGPNVKRQTENTLKCTKNFSHLQSRLTFRRIRMLEENQALQKQIQRAKEFENMQNGDEWDDSLQSKEEIEAKQLSKYEATIRRERAMAYSFSHQQPWKKSAGATNMLFMDPTNPQWGWSWSERYVPNSGNDNSPSKNGVNITKSEISKSYARHQNNSAPTTPRSKSGGLVLSRKPKPSPSPRATQGSGLESNIDDDAIKSVLSVISGSMVKKGDSLPNSPAARKRMVVAKSANTKPEEECLSENGKKQSMKRNSGSPRVE